MNAFLILLLLVLLLGNLHPDNKADKSSKGFIMAIFPSYPLQPQAQAQEALSPLPS